MAVLDNAVWFGGDGFTEGGTTMISEGGNNTTITGRCLEWHSWRH